MKRYFGWALKITSIYLLFLIAYFLFALASMSNESLAFYERKINPSTYVFWQNGEYFSNPPLFSSMMTDTKNQLVLRFLDGQEDVNIWVLLLEGPEDIENVEIASELGIDVQDVASTEPGNITILQGASINFRWHPLPLAVIRKHILIMDAKYLRENYKEQCLDEMVYGSMISQRDQKLWERCKKT